MASIDESVIAVLQGRAVAGGGLRKDSVPNWPTARLVKIFIASTKSDFKEERKLLLETIGPELQSAYDDRKIEVEMVDMHFGTGSEDNDPTDPRLIFEHLQEIRDCYKLSKGCFFICLLGNKYKSDILPENIEAEIFERILEKAEENGMEANVLKEWYIQNENGFYEIKDCGDIDVTEWFKIRARLYGLIRKCLQDFITSSEGMIDRYSHFFNSAVERQCLYALGLSEKASKKIIAVFRNLDNFSEAKLDETDKSISEYTDLQDSPIINNLLQENLGKLKKRLDDSLPTENNLKFLAPWQSGGIDSDNEVFDTYLSTFRDRVTMKLQSLIDKSVGDEPVEKGRKKTVPEILHEHVTHVTLCNDHLDTHGLSLSSEKLNSIKNMLTKPLAANTRHAPILIYGGHGSGKTTVLTNLYNMSESWFDKKVMRIIRFAGSSPRSAYNLELLRVVCQQLSIILNIPEGYLPKDASFDPLYINNWFQNILRRCEDLTNEVMLIFIDDLHKLNPLDCDIMAALSWLPINLPANVFFICTTSIHPDNLKLTPNQKERFRSADCYVELAGVNSYLIDNFNEKSLFQALKLQEVFESFEKYLECCFDAMERKFGKVAFGKLAGYITCSEFGLTETELLELLMPTSNADASISLESGNFNFSTLCTARRFMGALLRDKIMSGRLLLQWRHDVSADITRARYLNPEMQRTAHSEIANLFFSQLSDEAEDSQSVSEKSEHSAEDPEATTTPFNSSVRSDVTYSVRHVEESWLHLLRGGECTQLKEIAVCNFDFLLAAVQMVSISYLRCILEHVRCFILDRDIELVYYTIRKSSDVLTRDPMQLGAQVICWLRPVTDHNNTLITTMITSAMAWCDGYTVPLLVPLNGWLQPPLPLLIRTLTVTNGVRIMELTPTGQHLVIVPVVGDPQLYHIMSNSIVHTFKGHSGPVTCICVTKQSQFLITGSEDTSIIVWDLKDFALKLRIYEHIAPVLCLVCANNSVIASGGEDSSIIISSLATGALVMKIDHHRGPVTSVRINPCGDVLVSASHDKTICLWSLEDFTLLNTISLNSPVVGIDISADSVFILAACKDNGLYLRTLATGTELHSLKGHTSKIKGKGYMQFSSCKVLSMALAMDSQRAVIGCDNQRALVFDMHSGQLTKTLPVQAGPVTSVCVADKDDFLIIAGGNKVTFYSFRNEDTLVNFQPKKLKPSLLTRKSTYNPSPITCLDVSRDGQLAVTGTADGGINLWQLSTHEMSNTFNDHKGVITCVQFAPNGLFIVSGSDDKLVKVWGLPTGLVISTYKGHHASVESVTIMLDSRRVISTDCDDLICIWIADTANLIQSSHGPSKCLSITNNMKYAVCTNGDSTLKIWSLTREDEKYSVSHSEEITCFVVSVDSLYVITGSRDMSLKVWQATGGKLAQVLVGHSDAVTCVAVSVSNKSQVISGSRDSNLIVWDINTGSDLHTLAGHLAQVTCVKVTGDGSIAVSASDDKTIIIWETKRGLALTSLQLHVTMLGFDITSDCSRIVIHLQDSPCLPIVCLHNSPATFVKLPTYSAPTKDVEDLRRLAPKRPLRRLLKKEVSLDTYTWQRKYGHITSSIMMAQVDEKLKRRFSVSASMEEISKLAENKNYGSQTSIGPEQAALAQSQHFDQLEALWNKKSPPRRKNQLAKQSSLVENRIDSSDEDNEFEEETDDYPGE